jgi:hypothetical protein
MSVKARERRTGRMQRLTRLARTIERQMVVVRLVKCESTLIFDRAVNENAKRTRTVSLLFVSVDTTKRQTYTRDVVIPR